MNRKEGEKKRGEEEKRRRGEEEIWFSLIILNVKLKLLRLLTRKLSPLLLFSFSPLLSYLSL
jgi:hypothetical protein